MDFFQIQNILNPRQEQDTDKNLKVQTSYDRNLSTPLQHYTLKYLFHLQLNMLNVQTLKDRFMLNIKHCELINRFCVIFKSLYVTYILGYSDKFPFMTEIKVFKILEHAFVLN